MWTAKTAYVSGISLAGYNPFASMEINDQKNGKNGGIGASEIFASKVLRVNKTAAFASGIWNGKTSHTFSIVGR